ncbi:MAG TPA: hypothetical protein VHZ78_07315 [Rhizomicrobium sp.]|jgi:hypothetical protein|nr:hypothetical protein [Rhizomicrobium sp.]
MKDLSGRFAEAGETQKSDARPDPLSRLQQTEPDHPEAVEPASPTWLAIVLGRADLLAVVCVALAAALVLWPLLYPTVVQLPAIAQTGDEVATLTVHPMTANGVSAAPDWSSLFNAYQLETALRDISIRCNYGLPVDARIDRYLHAKLTVGSEIKIFLADPGVCPKL